MNKTLFKQADSRWGSKPYPSKGSSFAGNGCGCVACTHLIIENQQYKSLTPEPVRQWMVKQGYAVVNQGTRWRGIPATLKHYGYSKVVHIDRDDPMTDAWKELNKGNRIGVILFKAGKAPNGTVWTASGHYVAFTDYYVGKDGRHYFYTKDSGGRNHDSLTNGYYSYERSMKGLIDQMWVVERPKVDSSMNTSTKTSTAAESKITSIAVDGDFGSHSVTALQKVLGTTQDGKIGGQLTTLKKYHGGISSIAYGSGGSQTVRALQRMLKLSGIDGQLGPNTIKTFQKYLGMSGPDGYWGPNTSKAVQKWVNKKLAAMSAPTSTTTKPTPTTTTPAQSTSVKIKGMDISAWQGNISVDNFKKAKAAGIEFAILRVGYTGSSSKLPTLDKVFENNYKNAIAAGLPVGIYFYSLATTTTLAKAEADFVLNNIKGKKITYPVYIDVEDNATQGKASSSALASVCNIFCSTIAAVGYTAGVYASLSWFNSRIGNITAPHSKWVAQYYSKCEYKGAYDMWQYGSSEKVPGIADKVDVNWCYKKFTTPTIIEEAVKQLEPAEPQKSSDLDVIVGEILNGKWGSGDERKKKLEAAGYNYAEVQNRLNQILTVVDEVLAGKWGSGDTRKQKLTAAGYNYDVIQARINQVLAERNAFLQKLFDACKAQADWMRNSKYEYESRPTIEKSKKKGTCVTYIACVLQRIGILSSGQNLWHDEDNKVYGNNSKMTVIYPGNKTLSQLKSQLQAGDIIMDGTGVGSNSHIFILTGKWSGNKPYIWDNHSGQDGKGAYAYGRDRKVIAIVRLK